VADPGIQAQADTLAAKYFSASDLASFARDAHAGVRETSAVLALRPDLVRSSYRVASERDFGLKLESWLGQRQGR
jgi:hypothetical protein